MSEHADDFHVTLRLRLSFFSFKLELGRPP